MLDIFKKIVTGQPFALYITDDFIQVVQISGTASSPIIDAYGHKPIEKGIVKNGVILREKKLGEEIMKLLSEARPSPILSTTCFLAFPETQVYEHVFYLPAKLSTTDFRTNLNKLIADTIPVPFHELKSIYNKLTYGDVDIVAVTATKRETIAQYYEVLKHFCLLTPLTFEPESISLLRNIPRVFNHDQGIFLVDLREEKILWFTLWGEHIFDSDIISDSGMTFDEQLSKLIDSLKGSENCLFEKTNHEINEIIVSGSSSFENELIEKLQITFNIPVTKASKYILGNSQYKISCGIALKYIGVNKMGEINLLQK